MKGLTTAKTPFLCSVTPPLLSHSGHYSAAFFTLFCWLYNARQIPRINSINK
jgi:hypothetical protein